ncbi:MAG: ribokinase [Anaerolineae bacterium]|nr:ribokinase [Anaerolineae bacterium]
MPHIVVVGSLNMDLVVQVPTIPAPGETVLGNNFATIPGGKGANQAVAAARLGARVTLIGRVGADAFGEQLLANAKKEGIDVTHVGCDPAATSGVAMIAVDAQGQNSIAVASGANYCLTAVHVQEAWAALANVDLLVMPLETPLETIETAVSLANQAGVKVILNPAPAQKLSSSILAGVDVLVPNEPETAQLTGIEIDSAASSRQAAQALLKQGVGNVVLTLGSRGALVLNGETNQFTQVDPYPVKVVDTTAAGDAYVAGLAVALSEGKELIEAANFANAVGALAVTKQGAQVGMPTREEVENLLTQGV